MENNLPFITVVKATNKSFPKELVRFSY